MRVLLTLILLIPSFSLTFSENNDSINISKIYASALKSNSITDNLKTLCKKFPGRQAGSEISINAVQWTFQKMKEQGADTCYLQPTKVINWQRKKNEIAFLENSQKKIHLSVLSLGPSVGTNKWISANIIEVQNIKDLESLSIDDVKGKVVFFNEKMDSLLPYPFSAYGKTVRNRVYGANEASKKGAIAVLVRSLTFSTDSFPRTGNMRYKEDVEKIPAFVISTLHADMLSKILSESPDSKINLFSDIETGQDIISYNAIGEIKGCKKDSKIILVSGHIDSWYNCEGAHDDGAGCVQAMEVLKIFHEIGYKPKNTIRAVMYMDEEIDQRGSKEYANSSFQKNEKHLVAFESDMGGFAPIGFNVDAEDSIYLKIKSFEKTLEQFSPCKIKKGYGGVDIFPLKKQGIPLISLDIVPFRYFEFQHSAKDTYLDVNSRELKQGAAILAALIYLIDTYGL